MQIGYALSSEELRPREMVQYARRAEEVGFQFIAVSDHYHPWTDRQGQSPLREYKVKYRRPYGNAWEELDLDTAMEMIADRIVETRAATWQEKTEKGDPANRTLGIGNLGGATLDNEENYLIKKLCTALGIVQVENQARI